MFINFYIALHPNLYWVIYMVFLVNFRYTFSTSNRFLGPTSWVFIRIRRKLIYGSVLYIILRCIWLEQMPASSRTLLRPQIWFEAWAFLWPLFGFVSWFLQGNLPHRWTKGAAAVLYFFNAFVYSFYVSSLHLCYGQYLILLLPYTLFLLSQYFLLSPEKIVTWRVAQ